MQLRPPHHCAAGSRICTFLVSASCHPTSCLPAPYWQNNQLSGGLPPSWGSDTHGLHALRLLNVSDNVDLGGTLPSEWSAQHSFPALRTL